MKSSKWLACLAVIASSAACPGGGRGKRWRCAASARRLGRKNVPRHRPRPARPRCAADGDSAAIASTRSRSTPTRTRSTDGSRFRHARHAHRRDLERRFSSESALQRSRSDRVRSQHEHPLRVDFNGNSQLVTIDPATGAVTPLSNQTSTTFYGLAFDSNANVLYGTTGDSLYTLDTTTGSATLVGALGFFDVRGLAFDPGTDTLYGSNQTPGTLVTIDTATGAATSVGALGFPRVAGLAFDPNTHTLYATDTATGRFLTIDTATGAGADAGAFGFYATCGLAIDPGTNTMYGLDTSNFSTTSQLITIDRATAVATAVGAARRRGRPRARIRSERTRSTARALGRTTSSTIDTTTGVATPRRSDQVRDVRTCLRPEHEHAVRNGPDRALHDRHRDRGRHGYRHHWVPGRRGPDLRSNTNTLYGSTSFDTNNLLTIDTTTGVGTPVGPLGYLDVRARVRLDREHALRRGRGSRSAHPHRHGRRLRNGRRLPRLFRGPGPGLRPEHGHALRLGRRDGPLITIDLNRRGESRRTAQILRRRGPGLRPEHEHALRFGCQLRSPPPDRHDDRPRHGHREHRHPRPGPGLRSARERPVRVGLLRPAHHRHVHGRPTVVGPTGYAQIEGLAFDASTHTLYATETSQRRLLTLNTTTGAGTVIGPAGYVPGSPNDSSSRRPANVRLATPRRIPIITEVRANRRVPRSSGDPMPRPVCLFTGQWPTCPSRSSARGEGVRIRRPRSSPAGATTSMSSVPSRTGATPRSTGSSWNDYGLAGFAVSNHLAAKPSAIRSTSATSRSSPSASGATASPRSVKRATRR